jgi:hypothetical protein
MPSVTSSPHLREEEGREGRGGVEKRKRKEGRTEEGWVRRRRKGLSEFRESHESA